MSRTNNPSDLSSTGKVVGTVHSLAALRTALKLRPGAVDLLEIRVDAFATDRALLERLLPQLGFPLIITVRHPAEGGANSLSAAQRRELYAQFSPFGELIDVELRSIKALATTIADARAAEIKVILSEHHFSSTPSVSRLQRSLRRASKEGADIFKIATRAEEPSAVGALLSLLAKKQPLPLSVMAMGRLGRVSRLLFAKTGSVLNYGYLHTPNATGQWEAVLLKKRIAELEETA